MIDRHELLCALEHAPASELDRFREFLAAHTTSTIVVAGAPMEYCACGHGERTVLAFAGGWGGIELLYETILGLEGRNRVVVVDISPFDDPDAMSDAANQVLDREGIGAAVIMGQSLSGILAQLYARRHPGRVAGLVLTNTLAPRPERCRKWPLLLFRCLPMSLLRPLVRRKIGRLEKTEQEIPPAARERRRFARALIQALVSSSFTRQRIGRILRLAWRFNQEGAYRAEELAAFAGKVLLVTSEDDSYHQDARTLAATFPSAELFTLPSGYGHTAPQIHRDLFQATIQRFVDRLRDGECATAARGEALERAGALRA